MTKDGACQPMIAFVRIFVISSAVCAAWLLFLRPVAEQMHTLTKVMCEGETEYVWTTDPTGIHLVFNQSSTPELRPRNDSYSFTVGLQASSLSMPGAPARIPSLFYGTTYTSADDIRKRVSWDWTEIEAGMPCQDFDTQWYDAFQGSQLTQAILDVLQQSFGNTQISSCPELYSFSHCDDMTEAGQRARLFCPVTCGCADAVSGLLLSGSGNGCPTECQIPRASSVLSTAIPDCKDTNVSSAAMARAVINWETWVRGEKSSLDPNATGCSRLSSDVSVDHHTFNFCHADSMEHLGLSGMSALCPITCGCLTHFSPTSCPHACAPNNGTSGGNQAEAV